MLTPTFASLISLVAVAGAAVASPTRARQLTCTPDLSAPLSIAITGTNSADVREWGIPTFTSLTTKGGSLQTADWTFEQQPSGSYYIKPVTNDSLGVGVVEDNPLSLLPVASADSTLEWDIVCDTCTPDAINAPIASGCHIKSAATGWCAQVLSPNDNYLVRAVCGYLYDTVELWRAQ